VPMASHSPNRNITSMIKQKGKHSCLSGELLNHMNQL
jgi:hypothetical protein